VALHDELLNETLFTSLDHAREVLTAWKADYNTIRPHSALANLPPATYAKVSAPVMQRDGALRYLEGSAPRPVAPPSHPGSNEESQAVRFQAISVARTRLNVHRHPVWLATQRSP
jgi:putative transposase